MDKISTNDIIWLLELLEREQLLEIEISDGEARICVRAPGATLAAAPMVPVPMVAGQYPAPAADAAAPDPENTERLLSPMAGIFYRAPSPDAAPYVEPGDEVHVGDTIGLIEAMKLYNEVTTHVHGRIVRFLVENEQHIEADQPLVLIERFHQ